jgi:hypothetical protein
MFLTPQKGASHPKATRALQIKNPCCKTNTLQSKASPRSNTVSEQVKS